MSFTPVTCPFLCVISATSASINSAPKSTAFFLKPINTACGSIVPSNAPKVAPAMPSTLKSGYPAKISSGVSHFTSQSRLCCIASPALASAAFSKSLKKRFPSCLKATFGFTPSTSISSPKVASFSSAYCDIWIFSLILNCKRVFASERTVEFLA